MSNPEQINDAELLQKFLPIFGSDEDFSMLQQQRPHLAHYTSILALEKIVESGEIWFSNPLFMNDYEEMRFGVKTALKIFSESTTVAEACGTPERTKTAKDAYAYFYNQFDTEHAFDVYVFCLSLIAKDNNDGILSMWRSYGSNGDGAAIVFNTDFIQEEGTPRFLIAKVNYASKEMRFQNLQKRLQDWCNILKSLPLTETQLQLVTYYFFLSILIYALTSKHIGFSEENEWRLIYLPVIDPQGLQKPKFSYAIGKNGVEPKLKLPIEPQGDPNATWTFETIVNRIILGPSFSTYIAIKSVERMLETSKRPVFAKRVVASTIPLRPESRWFNSEL